MQHTMTSSPPPPVSPIRPVLAARLSARASANPLPTALPPPARSSNRAARWAACRWPLARPTKLAHNRPSCRASSVSPPHLHRSHALLAGGRANRSSPCDERGLPRTDGGLEAGMQCPRPEAMARGGSPNPTAGNTRPTFAGFCHDNCCSGPLSLHWGSRARGAPTCGSRWEARRRRPTTVASNRGKVSSTECHY
jgi:hypothetical protein